MCTRTRSLTVELFSVSAWSHFHSSVSVLIVTLLSPVCVGVKVGGGQRAKEVERMKRIPTAVRYKVSRWGLPTACPPSSSTIIFYLRAKSFSSISTLQL